MASSTRQAAKRYQVTNYPLDVGTLKVSPAGDRVALTIEVLPGVRRPRLARREALDAPREEQGSPAARTIGSSSATGTRGATARARIFLSRPLPTRTARPAPPFDLSKALDADVPSKPFGGDEEYVFSPDGSRLVFSARAAGREEAWSTNFDLYEVAVGGSTAPRSISRQAIPPGTRNRFSWGTAISLISRWQRPGFESDRFHVVIRHAPTGASRPLTKSWDRSIGRLKPTTPDGRTLLASADDVGQHALFTTILRLAWCANS